MSLDRYIIREQEPCALVRIFQFYSTRWLRAKRKIIRSTSIHTFRLGDYGGGNEPFSYLISVAEKRGYDVLRGEIAS